MVAPPHHPAGSRRGVPEWSGVAHHRDRPGGLRRAGRADAGLPRVWRRVAGPKRTQSGKDAVHVGTWRCQVNISPSSRVATAVQCFRGTRIRHLVPFIHPGASVASMSLPSLSLNFRKNSPMITASRSDSNDSGILSWTSLE